MREKEIKFTLRISETMARKLDFIADYNGRSRSSEINVVLRKYILDYESEHGPITDEEYKSI